VAPREAVHGDGPTSDRTLYASVHRRPDPVGQGRHDDLEVRMSNRSSFIRIASVTAAALVAVGSLVACSSGSEVTAGTSFDVEISDPDGASPFAVSQLMVGTSVGATSATEAASTPGLATANLVEVDNGVWIGNTIDAQAGATVEVALPAEDEIPAGTLANVERAFINATQAADCSVVASPSSAVVTTVLFEGYAAPGLVAIGGFGEAAALYLSDATVDPSSGTLPDGMRIYTWIHSDISVDVTFVGTDCGMADADLSLSAGWNSAAWVFDAGTSGWTLENVDAPDVFVGTVGPF